MCIDSPVSQCLPSGYVDHFLFTTHEGFLDKTGLIRLGLARMPYDSAKPTPFGSGA